METTKKLENFLNHHLSPEHADTEAPGLEHVLRAREAVLARAKSGQPKRSVFSPFIAFLNFDLKFYHLGISVILVMFGTFYITESHYDVTGASTLSQHTYNTLSINSPTAVSVNSSTMLTSIPTLRN